VCEEANVGFNLSRNRPVDPVFTRGSVGGGLGMVALLGALFALFWFRESEPVRILVEDARDAREAVASRTGRAASGVLGEGSYRPSGGSSGSSGSRSASPRPAGGGSTGGSTGGRAATGGATGGRTTPGGGTAPTASAPAAQVPQSQRPVAGAPPPAEAAAPGLLVYRARGDRREQLDLDAARIIQRRGAAEAALMRSVQYDAGRDETLVVVDPESVEWPRRLGWLRGWRRIQEP
jgi:hypothetical protein